MIDTTPDFLYDLFCQDAQDDLDEIDMGNIRAFTWVPNPAKYPSSEPAKQYKSLLNHVLLSSFKFFRLFCFVPELTENGNIHIHGWFIIKDRVAFYKIFLPKCRQYGFTLIKTNVDEDWFDYVSKDMSTTIDVVGEDLPVPLTHLNCKAYRKGYTKGLKARLVPRKMDLSKLFNKI